MDKHDEILERIARLEERVKMLECLVRKQDTRLWAIVAGIILSILVQILLR